MNNVQYPTGCQRCKPVTSGHVDTGIIVDDGQAYNPLQGGTIATRTESERSPCQLWWLYPPTTRANSRVYPTPTNPGVYMSPYMNKEYNNVIPEGFIANPQRYVEAVEQAKAEEVAGVNEMKGIHNTERKLANAAQSIAAVGLEELAASTPSPGSELEDVAEDFGRPPLVIPIQPDEIGGVESPESINRFVRAVKQGSLMESYTPTSLSSDNGSPNGCCLSKGKIFGMSAYVVIMIALLVVVLAYLMKKYGL